MLIQAVKTAQTIQLQLPVALTQQKPMRLDSHILCLLACTTKAIKLSLKFHTLRVHREHVMYGYDEVLFSVTSNNSSLNLHAGL